MKKLTLKFSYKEEKLKAIRVSLKEKNKDLDEEIVKFLDTLYQKNVPKVLKKYIENSLEIEQENSKKSEEETNNKFNNEKKDIASNNQMY